MVESHCLPVQLIHKSGLPPWPLSRWGSPSSRSVHSRVAWDRELNNRAHVQDARAEHRNSAFGQDAGMHWLIGVAVLAGGVADASRPRLDWLRRCALWICVGRDHGTRAPDSERCLLVDVISGSTRKMTLAPGGVELCIPMPVPGSSRSTCFFSDARSRGNRRRSFLAVALLFGG